MDEHAGASLAKLDTALRSARTAWEELAGDSGPVPRCAPGEHALPDSARPGQPTKCRRCRASVRAPRTGPAEADMMPRAEHEAFREKVRALLEAQQSRIAELEDQLGGRRAAESAPESAPERPAVRAIPSQRRRPAVPAAASTGADGSGSGHPHPVTPAWGSSMSGRYQCETCKRSGAAQGGWLSGPQAAVSAEASRA